MPELCVISHAHTDAAIARALATLIERVSLTRIKTWHSSDETGFGGIGAGQKWFDTIIDKLRRSRAIIALITEDGRDRPWIYFETGFAAAHPDMNVIPVAIGLDEAHDQRSPLYNYEWYALIDMRSVAKFLEKLLAIFDVKFDEEMSQPPMRAFVAEIGRIAADTAQTDIGLPASELGTTSAQIDPGSILSHIDRRLREFVEVAAGRQSVSEYPVDIDIDFPAMQTTIAMSIGTDDSVQDILDALWGVISEQVPVYTYLERWVLKDKSSGAYLVGREIGELVPARYIFRPEIRWVAVPLDHPYSPNSRKTWAAGAFRHLSSKA